MPNMRGSKRRITDYFHGGAGAGVARRSTARNRYRGRRSGYHGMVSELGQHAQQRVRGVGVLRGKDRAMPGPIRMNMRTRTNMPLSVGHNIKTELRSKPGCQAVVTCIAERLMPLEDYSGRLIESVNRTTAGTELSNFYKIKQYTNGTDDVPPVIEINHRQDWTMFTNGSWRDGYAYVNGGLTTGARMRTGYDTPYKTGTDTVGLTNTLGTPSNWASEPASMLQTIAGSGNTTLTFPNAGATPIGAGVTTLINNYYHLYEELSWKIHNPSITATTVTIYECVLNRDIPLRLTPSCATESVGELQSTVIWGGMPCPLELWRQSQAINAMQSGQIDINGSTRIEGVTPFPPDGSTEGVGMASADFGDDPTTTAVNSGLGAKDIDYPNVLPHKAQLLHTYYKVIPHTRRIPPGASTTITIAVKYNKRVAGAWWNSLYAVSGLSRTFFMVSRPDEVVGLTGVDEDAGAVPPPANRLAVMNGTDLLVEWTKKKTCAKSKTATRRSVFFKSAIPEIDDVAMRNLVTGKVHDADVVMGAGAEGGLANEDL